MDNAQNLFFIILLASFFFWIALSQQGLGFSGGDGQEHIIMANEPDYNPNYAPLFRSFSQFFVKQEMMWSFFTFFLLIVVPNLLLFKITKEPLVTIFFFAVSNLFYFFLASLFAQLLMFIFVLVLFVVKDNRFRVLIVFVGALSHAQAPIMLTLVWLLIILNERFSSKILGFLYSLKQRFPKNVVLGIGGCSPFWGNNIPSFLNNPIGGVGYVPAMITLNKLFAFFIKIAPLPFVFVAFREFLKRGRFDLIIIWFVGFFGAWFVSDRVWYLSGLVTIIGFAWAWRDLQHKNFWLVLVLFYLVFLFQQFVWGRWFC